MNKAIAWMADNHVAANLLMMLILIMGFVSVKSLKQEVFPEIEQDIISVQVMYRGASPEEIEQSVILKIEDAVVGVDGVEAVHATALEGLAAMSIEVEMGEDVTAVKELIQAEIDRIPNLPDDADKPIVKEMKNKALVIQLGVQGDMDEVTLKKAVQQVKDDLLKDSHITSVAISGIRNYEMSIEVKERDLRAYGLTFDMITAAIKRGSMDMPGGNLKADDGEILIRTKSLGYTRVDYENIIIRSGPLGNTVLLKDVAVVHDTFEDSDLITSFDGKPSALITVYRAGDQGAIDVAAAVKKYIAHAKEYLPAGVKLILWQDQSIILKERLDLLYRNALMGLVLVLISLTLFLDLRLAIWVSAGIGISFFGSFIVMQWMGVSLNMISLFGFILILGIVVDDAIVVGENIFTHRTAGMDPLEASQQGTSRVAVPVVFAVLTTIAAFSPLLVVDGMMGKIMGVIPVIVIAVLVFSLIESLFILPAHLSSIKMGSTNKVFSFFERLSKRMDIWLGKIITQKYLPFLVKALKHKFLVVACGITAFLVTVGMITSGIVPFSFMPETEGDNVYVHITMPKGSSGLQTYNVLKEVEKQAHVVRRSYEKEGLVLPDSMFKHVYSVVGELPSTQKGPHSGASLIDPTIAEVNIELQSADNRSFKGYEFMNRWRNACAHITGVKSLIFNSALISAGNAFQLKISARTDDDLQEVVHALKDKLTEYTGVYDIRDDFEKGKYEMKLKLKPEAASLGLTLSDLARQVRQGYYGAEALRIQRGSDEVKVMVRYTREERASVGSVEQTMIRTPQGNEVPFTDVAEIDYGRGYAQINRSNQARVITVIANVDEDQVSTNALNKDMGMYLHKVLAKKYKGLTFEYEGVQKEQKKSMGSLMRGFVIALFLIYLLLAVPFKSYLQPFVIMSAIPFGFIGVVLGHLIMGYRLTMMSGMGMVALAGVVVNDSLVLVDFINGLRRSGMPLSEAILEGSRSRFRPIMLTSLTTFLGLAPMMLERSFQAQMIVPMAISLGFGIVFATAITLVLIPVGILMLENMKQKFGVTS